MESEDISLENSCRLCLKRINGEVLSVSIFDTVPSCNSSIPVKIKTCVSIDVQAEDLLPQCICKDCHNKLDDFFAFKQVCLTADLQLKTLLLPTTTHNDITNDKGTFEGSYGDTIQDYKSCQDSTIQRIPSRVTVSPLDMEMFSLSTIKTEPYYSEGECGLAEAMELDALSDDAETGASNVEPSTTTERPPILILETFSLTCDNQRINETPVKVESPDDDSDMISTIEMPDQDVFGPIKVEIITEQETLNENMPLAHYMSRKIIGVHNGNFIYNINYEGTSGNKERPHERSDRCCESPPGNQRADRDARGRFVAHVCPEASGDGRRPDHQERATPPVASRPTPRELRPRVSRQQFAPPTFACDVCGLTVENQGALENHQTTAHRTTFACDVCGLAVENQGALENHQTSAHRSAHPPPRKLPRLVAGPRPAKLGYSFSCDVCGLGFQHKGALESHRSSAHCSTHPPPRKLPRPVDGPSRAKPGDSFSCEPCGLGFQHKGALICHQAFYHRLEMNKNVARAQIFTCEVCSVIFTRKDRYVIHKELHKYDKPTEENGLAVNQLHHFLTLNQNYTI